MHKIVENDATHSVINAKITKKLKEDIDDKLEVCLYLKNVNIDKCGGLMKNLNSQMSLKNDKLSEELTDANNALDKYQ